MTSMEPSKKRKKKVPFYKQGRPVTQLVAAIVVIAIFLIWKHVL